MKRIIKVLLPMLMITSFPLYSQLVIQHFPIKYEYDSAGNRIKRSQYITKYPYNQNIQNTPTPDIIPELFEDKGIKIYPNPTKGPVTVEISNLPKDEECNIDVYSVFGIRLLSKKVESSITEIDLTSQHKGVYLLCITLQGETATWKILKH